MTVNGIKYYRYSIRIDQIFFFESLLKENNIDYFNEKEIYTNVKTTIFYINEKDSHKLNQIETENDIELLDDYSPVSDQRYWINNLPKPIRIIIQILIFIFVILFILQII